MAALDEVDRLRRELDGLRASRARLVAAGDEERRDLERLLHDGVQQQLVALAVRLQLLTGLEETDPRAADTLIAEIRDDVQDALEDVRLLAERLYPAILGLRGLAAALRSASSGVGIPVRVVATSTGDCPRDLAVLAYRCCLDVLAAVAVRAGDDAQATVEIRADDGMLVFELVAGGAEAPPVSNLDAVEARLDARGGRLLVETASPNDIRITGTVPVPLTTSDR
jgi:signal transduction histidine kinase